MFLFVAAFSCLFATARAFQDSLGERTRCGWKVERIVQQCALHACNDSTYIPSPPVWWKVRDAPNSAELEPR